jgi:hypothetical protein
MSACDRDERWGSACDIFDPASLPSEYFLILFRNKGLISVFVKQKFALSVILILFVDIRCLYSEWWIFGVAFVIETQF